MCSTEHKSTLRIDGKVTRMQGGCAADLITHNRHEIRACGYAMLANTDEHGEPIRRGKMVTSYQVYRPDTCETVGRLVIEKA